MRWPLLLAAAALAACTASPPVTADLRDEATRFVREELDAPRATPSALWYADRDPGSMICGEVPAPAALASLRDRLRFVFQPGMTMPTGQIEYHELAIAGDPATAAALAGNRSAFNAVWDEHCRAAAPAGRAG